MIVQYIIFIYNSIKNYFYCGKINYNLPFDQIIIENDPEFTLYKNINNNYVNQTVFILNNLPEIVHSLLFKNNQEVCSKYFFINVNIKSKNDELTSNLNEIDEIFQDNLINYIFIRINIIKKDINHVNCIIINKEKKTVFIFEPKSFFVYDLNVLIDFLDGFIDLTGFKVILPKDIGYSYFNRLQYFDGFCQTYVLLVFLNIVNNKEIEFNYWKKMFNTIITNKNIGYFLFHLYTLLKINSYLIEKDMVPNNRFWSYPTNKLKNVWNLLGFYVGSTSVKKDNSCNKDSIVKFIEDDDFILY